MKKRTIAMFLSVALCLSVALTGCGADKSQQSNPSDDGKKSLTIAVLNDVVSLDPAVKDSGIEMQMASHLYDPSRVLTDTGRGFLENTSSKKAASSFGWARNPEPLPLAVTVPEGQPRFRLTSV